MVNTAHTLLTEDPYCSTLLGCRAQVKGKRGSPQLRDTLQLSTALVYWPLRRVRCGASHLPEVTTERDAWYFHFYFQLSFTFKEYVLKPEENKTHAQVISFAHFNTTVTTISISNLEISHVC